MKKLSMVLVIALTVLLFSQCLGVKKDFVIVSGSENKSLEPLLIDFGEKNGLNIIMKYKGSVDIMLGLSSGTLDCDAVWPANSLWVSLGDTKKKVKHLESVMTSPVVFGVRKSLAEDLGLTGGDVKVTQILELIKQEKIQFMMTSATQSNSGAGAYLGFLYALSGGPDVLTNDHLHAQELTLKIRNLLGGIHRSSGSSGWLKDLFLQGDYDAMVNYEALIIETNRELVRQGREPLYVIYPSDGLVIADSPIGYIKRGEGDTEESFKRIREFLLSSETQKEISKLGRRTGLGGIMGDTDITVFNPAWGINTNKIMSHIKLPSRDVLLEALNLYQTDFRKPSFTVFCLDYSGSMADSGEKQMKDAMSMLLQQDQARKSLIQAGSNDVTVVLAFSHKILEEWRVEGNDPKELDKVLREIRRFEPDGATDIYTPTIKGLEYISEINTRQYIPAVILLTDGESNEGLTINDARAMWRQKELDVPVFSIMFGAAKKSQLEELAEMSRGKVFDGRNDLITAFRKAKGYN